MSNNPVSESSPAKYYDKPTLDLAEAIHAEDDGRLDALLTTGQYDLADRGKEDTPLLLYAAASENFDAVRILLRRGADPNDVGDVGYGPMSLVSIASGMTEQDFFQILLDSGADPNGVGGTDPPLFIAIKAENWDMMRALIERGADMNGLDSSGSTPLILLARTNCYQQAMELIELGADPLYVSPAGSSMERTIRRFPLDPSTDKGQWQQKVIRHLNLKM